MESNFNLPPDVVISWFPNERNMELMSDEDFYLIIATELGFSSVEGKSRVTRNGDTIKDSITLTPLPPKDVIKDYFSTKGWLKKESFKMDALNTLSGFAKHYEETTGKTSLGAEYYAALNNHVKDRKEFDWHN